jgi:arginine-tRNA-protein transferase
MYRPPSHKLNLFLTLPHTCSYLPERTAATLFADPAYPKDKGVCSHLLQQGFRRSGDILYKPYCGSCQSCVSVRIAVKTFKPRRNQRRIWQKNQDLHIIEKPPEYCDQHFDLYQRYVSARHSDGGMDDVDAQSYMRFLTVFWADTRFYEFRRDDALLAVAVVDHVDDGLSAVYTFFEPNEEHRSLGTYCVLWEVETAWHMGLEYVYLGYWIKECRKMAYKNHYQPLQGFINGEWRAMEDS